MAKIVSFALENWNSLTIITLLYFTFIHLLYFHTLFFYFFLFLAPFPYLLIVARNEIFSFCEEKYIFVFMTSKPLNRNSFRDNKNGTLTVGISGYFFSKGMSLVSSYLISTLSWFSKFFHLIIGNFELSGSLARCPKSLSFILWSKVL